MWLLGRCVIDGRHAVNHTACCLWHVPCKLWQAERSLLWWFLQFAGGNQLAGPEGLADTVAAASDVGALPSQ